MLAVDQAHVLARVEVGGQVGRAVVATVGGVPLGPLDHDRHVTEQPVATAVVEVQVGAHDHVEGGVEGADALVHRRLGRQLAGEVVGQPTDARHRVDAHVGVESRVEHQAALRVLDEVREHRDPDLPRPPSSRPARSVVSHPVVNPRTVTVMRRTLPRAGPGQRCCEGARRRCARCRGGSCR